MNEDPKHTPMSGLYAKGPQRHENHRKGRRVSIRAILAVVLAVFLIVIWYAYPRGADRYEDLKLPVIRADNAGYKERPTDPGGMPIPHQDSTVFEPLETPDGEAVENLLPAPEEPVERAKLIKVPRDAMSEPARLNLDAQMIEDEMAEMENEGVQIMTDEVDDMADAEPEILLGGEDVAESGSTMPPQPEQSEPTISLETAAANDAPADRTATTEETQPEPETEKAVEETASEPVEEAETAQVAISEEESVEETAPPVTEGRHYIQMGSFKDRPAAEKAHELRMNEYSNLLSGLDVDYERADLGDKGVFYRLKIGPLAESDARNRCEAILQQSPGACFVTR